jgi:hypothetical protein
MSVASHSLPFGHLRAGTVVLASSSHRDYTFEDVSATLVFRG